VRRTALVLAIPAVILLGAAVYSYISFGRLLDARLHGERERVRPRVYARPLELRRGQALTDRQLVERLNDLGYTERPGVTLPGEFAVGDGSVALRPRSDTYKGQLVRVVFQRPLPAVASAARRARKPAPADHVVQLQLGARSSERLILEAPLLTSSINGEREKRRPTPLAAIPPRMVQAVLAIEDRRFYEHPGIDPIRMVGALVSNMRGRRAYVAGASTITQQLVRNVFMPTFAGMTLQTAREK
jgi:penicillin-binding protein 1B